MDFQKFVDRFVDREVLSPAPEIKATLVSGDYHLHWIIPTFYFVTNRCNRASLFPVDVLGKDFCRFS